MDSPTTGHRRSLEELAIEVEQAALRLAPMLPATPLRPSFWLSETLDADVWLKCENLQPTGSFKARGALNRLLREAELDGSDPGRGADPTGKVPHTGSRHVVAASTGNHGAAVAFAARQIGRRPSRCTVFVPEGTASAKLSTVQRLGAEIRVVGSDSLESEVAARAFAEVESALYVSPYNDPWVVAGQGTAAIEIDAQLEAAGGGPAEVVVASLGGGGLISGIAAGFRRRGRTERTRVLAVSPDRSKVMHESVKAGRILDLPSSPTLSDGTAGGVEPGSVTFDWVRDGVDEFVVVDEEQIASTLCECVAEERLLIEGAAALAIAGAMAEQVRESIRGRTVVIVLCGANLAAAKLAELLLRHRSDGSSEPATQSAEDTAESA